MVKGKSFDDILNVQHIEEVNAFLKDINRPQDRQGNRERFDHHGGFNKLSNVLHLDQKTGLTEELVQEHRSRHGTNTFPVAGSPGLLSLLLDAASDLTLLILIFAASLSLLVELLLGSHGGWVEGVAILAAVVLVCAVTAANNYFRTQQFAALELAAANEEITTVLRAGSLQQVHPSELVVGDVLVLSVGDCVPADAILLDPTAVLLCDESSLTGEAKEVPKRMNHDCFLLSSSLVLHGAQCRAIVISVGIASQWGQIKANLVPEAQETPLQEKLSQLAQKFSFLGATAALAIYACLALRIFFSEMSNGQIVSALLKAFIFVTTVVVAAVPEGLPLAVTMTLAYCNRQLYSEQCLVRTLAACETMGNVTTICTDKTGTLTENRMAVVAGWAIGQDLDKDAIQHGTLSKGLQDMIALNIALNRTAMMIESKGTSRLTGNSTEIALLRLISGWGYDADAMKSQHTSSSDEIEAFDSFKKQSAVIITPPPAMANRGMLLKLIKGAPEMLLERCTHIRCGGNEVVLDAHTRQLAQTACQTMARRSLRTLVLAHEYVPVSPASPLTPKSPRSPSGSVSTSEGVMVGLCLDCLLGIADPLRDEAAEAIALAQQAGIKVRLMTGDSLPTAISIAADCGILPSSLLGSPMDLQLAHSSARLAITGDRLRTLTPAELDALLPSLSVIARCSPEDKLLLVCRLSGHHLPKDESEWTARAHRQVHHRDQPRWETHRDRLLPGYQSEWSAAHPDGGDVVAVTGDGTNDAPALNAADIGLAMGRSGTKVSQAAADMVLLDDNFRSIVAAILWGRAVYDNVRKFLQFQMTANITALVIIFVAAVAGLTVPLTAVQILWLNMIMDPLGALALAMEPPDRNVLLHRKPYKRSATLITAPMWRNVLCQSAGLIALMLTLLFIGPSWLHLPNTRSCSQYAVASDADSSLLWDAPSGLLSSMGSLSCQSFASFCSEGHSSCYSAVHGVYVDYLGDTAPFTFSTLTDFKDKCLQCDATDHSYSTFVFNAFMFYQIFNLWNARSLFAAPSASSWDGDWSRLLHPSQFFIVFMGMVGFQLLLVCVGGEFLQTTRLRADLLFLSIALGASSLLVGVLMKMFIPAVEGPELFADTNQQVAGGKKMLDFEA